jgi:hypothetical protein
MGFTVRRHSLLVLILAGSAVLTSCTASTGGQAVAENPSQATETTRPSTGPGTRPTTGSPQAGNSPMADTDPCTMLDAAAKAKLGISGAGEPRNVGVARGCRWRVRGPSDTYFIGVSILDNAGITDIPSTVRVDKFPNIGSHEAVQGKEQGGGAGGCTILIGVTRSSRVDLNVIAGTDTQKACDLMMELAKQVEPKLP